MHKGGCTFDSEVGFGSLVKQKYLIQGDVLKNQGVVEEV